MDEENKTNPFSNIAHMRGLSGQILFAMDADSKPGKTICHFVRLETIEMDDELSEVPADWLKLEKKSDMRLEHLSDCFARPANAAIQEAIMIMSGLMTCVGNVLQITIPCRVGSAKQRAAWAIALARAVKFMGTGAEQEPPPAADESKVV